MSEEKKPIIVKTTINISEGFAQTPHQASQQSVKEGSMNRFTWALKRYFDQIQRHGRHLTPKVKVDYRDIAGEKTIMIAGYSREHHPAFLQCFYDLIAFCEDPNIPDTDLDKKTQAVFTNLKKCCPAVTETIALKKHEAHPILEKLLARIEQVFKENNVYGTLASDSVDTEQQISSSINSVQSVSAKIFSGDENKELAMSLCLHFKLEHYQFDGDMLAWKSDDYSTLESGFSLIRAVVEELKYSNLKNDLITKQLAQYEAIFNDLCIYNPRSPFFSQQEFQEACEELGLSTDHGIGTSFSSNFQDTLNIDLVTAWAHQKKLELK